MNKQMNKNTSKLFGILAASFMVLSSVMPAMAQTPPKIVAGKVIAVTHERVTVNTSTLDKVSVTVDSCAQPGMQETVVYPNASVTELAVLGHLFDGSISEARTADMSKQATMPMPNGYGLFWVDPNSNVVQRAGLLGNPVNCAHIGQLVSQFK